MRVRHLLAIAALFAAGAAVADDFQNAGAVQCAASGGTATLVGDGAGLSKPRRVVFLQNLGPEDIYVGFSTSVTAATGVRVPANGGTWSANVSKRVHVYCVGATALQVSPNNTRFEELSTASQ